MQSMRKRKRNPGSRGYKVTSSHVSGWDLIYLYPNGQGGAAEVEELRDLVTPDEVTNALFQGQTVGVYFVQYEIVQIVRKPGEDPVPYKGSTILHRTPTVFRHDGICRTVVEHEALHREDGAILLQYLVEDPTQRLIRFNDGEDVCYVPWSEEDRQMPPDERGGVMTEGEGESPDVLQIEAVREACVMVVFESYNEKREVVSRVEVSPFGQDETRVAFSGGAFAFKFAVQTYLVERSPNAGTVYVKQGLQVTSGLFYRSDCVAVSGEELLAANLHDEVLKRFVGSPQSQFVRLPKELAPQGSETQFLLLEKGDRILSSSPKEKAFVLEVFPDDNSAKGDGLGGMNN